MGCTAGATHFYLLQDKQATPHQLTQHPLQALRSVTRGRDTHSLLEIFAEE